MQATLARIDNQPPDWGQIGGWLATALATGAAIWAGFKGNWKGFGTPSPTPESKPSLPPVVEPGEIAREGGMAIATLERLAHTLEEQNDRLYERVGEQDAAMQVLRDQIGTQDEAMRGLRRHLGEQDVAIQRVQALAARYRAKLVQAGIDPGDG